MNRFFRYSNFYYNDGIPYANKTQDCLLCDKILGFVAVSPFDDMALNNTIIATMLTIIRVEGQLVYAYGNIEAVIKDFEKQCLGENDDPGS